MGNLHPKGSSEVMAAHHFHSCLLMSAVGPAMFPSSSPEITSEETIYV